MRIGQKASTTVGVKELKVNGVTVGFIPCYTGGGRRSWGRKYAGNAVRANLVFPSVADAWAFVDNLESHRDVPDSDARLVDRDGVEIQVKSRW
jgi:hypothetical protein